MLKDKKDWEQEAKNYIASSTYTTVIRKQLKLADRTTITIDAQYLEDMLTGLLGLIEHHAVQIMRLKAGINDDAKRDALSNCRGTYDGKTLVITKEKSYSTFGGYLECDHAFITPDDFEEMATKLIQQAAHCMRRINRVPGEVQLSICDLPWAVGYKFQVPKEAVQDAAKNP